MNTKKIAMGIGGVLAVGLALSAYASSSFWEDVASKTSELLAGKAIQDYPASQAKMSAPKLGATYSNQFLAETSMTESVSGSSTTTVCSLLNSDGVDRVIQEVDLWFNPDDTAGNGVATGTYSGNGDFKFSMTTSTVIGTSSTISNGPTAIFPLTSFSTSTAQQWFTSTTFTNVNAHQWKNNEYLIVKSDQPASSTGFCAVTYFNK